MRIMILLGSPHKQGTTAKLAAAFEKGALLAGHSVETVYVPGEKVAPCLSCGVCRKTGSCAQRDSAPGLIDKLMTADAIVFVSPLYYFNMTAQLKTLIDRFYMKPALRDTHPKACLLTAGADDEDWAFAPIQEAFRAICRYMRFTEGGIVAAYGCASPDAEELNKYLEEAETLGKRL